LREATESYHDEGLRQLELAQIAHEQYLAANPEKQAKILKCVGSNLMFDGKNVTATYRKPFDILAERPSNENWLPGLDLTRTRLAAIARREANTIRHFARIVA
jgi:hypothetical protein